MKAGSQGVMSNGPQQFYLGCLGMEGPGSQNWGCVQRWSKHKNKWPGAWCSVRAYLRITQPQPGAPMGRPLHPVLGDCRCSMSTVPICLETSPGCGHVGDAAENQRLQTTDGLYPHNPTQHRNTCPASAWLLGTKGNIKGVGSWWE